MEEKIFSISNYIYSHTKGTIDYTSIKSILTSLIGFRITFTQEEFNMINQKVLFLKSLLANIEVTMNQIKNMNSEEYTQFIINNHSLYDTYLEDFNCVFDELNTDIYNLKNKGFYILLNNSEKEKNKEGTEWLYTLFDFYIKYKGKGLVSAIDFFYHIRKIWRTIEDKETIEISHITDNMLGGISILNISNNLKDWLIKNGDIVKREYRDIIDTSLPIILKKINEFEIIEFIPEYTFLNGGFIFDTNHFKLKE